VSAAAGEDWRLAEELVRERGGFKGRWSLFHRDPERIVGVLRVTLLNRLNSSREWAELPLGRQTLHHDWPSGYRRLQKPPFILSLGIELAHSFTRLVSARTVQRKAVSQSKASTFLLRGRVNSFARRKQSSNMGVNSIRIVGLRQRPFFAKFLRVLDSARHGAS
jgi:hypothetical protein